ncbi:MAG: hypothetical protein K1X63_05380 [Chitinophagales bacterium]|nr:hypothetical protein [Chitinophagales bacterium]
MSELSIWLDTYDDLYSDFDPRPYGKRLVSHDFINELKRNMHEISSGPVQLGLFIPEPARKREAESEIITSLQNYFFKNLNVAEHALRKLVQQGIWMGLIGIALLLIATYMVYEAFPGFLATAVTVVLQPAGWFLVWNGLDNIFFESKELKNERSFLGKMQDCSIQFRSLNSATS